jgi:hypothetical protein
MPVAYRQFARRALAGLGIYVDHVGGGTYTVRREPWPGRFRLVDTGPHAALLARGRLSPGDRWQRDRRLFNWIAQRHLAELLTRYDVNVVLDVGANVGQYGQLLRQVGYTGHIVSIEPVPACYAELSQWAAADNLWSVHNVAVPMRRLDELLDRLLPAGLDRPRIFLKMDTQGYDLEAFAGLGERHRDVVGLQSELALLCSYDDMPRLPQALAVYEAAGFEVTGMFPVNRDGSSLRIIEYDCMMVRAEPAN